MALRNAFEDLATEATLQQVLDALGGAGGRLDSNNSTFTALGPTAPGGQTFTGGWTESKGQAALSFFAFTDQPLTTAKLEWSDDGVTKATGLLAEADYLTSEEVIDGFYVYYPDPQTYLLRDYYRVVLENTGSDQALLEAYMWEFPTGSAPFAFLDADGVPSTLQKALLTKPVNAALLISEFSDAVDGTIPSGALPAIDPVLNTEPNVLDSGWIDTATFAGKNVVGVLGDTSLKVFLMNATDNQGDNIFGDGAPTLVTQANFPAQLSALYSDKYYRIVVVNDSGADLTSYRVQSRAAPESTEGVTTAIDQPVFGFFPAQIGRSVVMGRQPDGDFVNVPATGLAYDVGGSPIETTTPLGAAGVYETGWIDTDGFDEIEVTVIADQVSGTDGFEIEYTDDVQATTPSVVTAIKNTVTANELAPEGLIWRGAPRADGFRLRYTNGGQAQTEFYLGVVLRADATALPRAALRQALGGTTEAITTKSVLAARNETTGEYENIGQSPNGGVRTAITEHEAKTPLASSDDFEPVSTTVGTSPAQIATPPLPGRTSILIINNSSNRSLRVGNTSAGVNGSSYLEVPPLGGVSLPLTENATVYVRSSSSTCEYSYAEFAEVSDA